MRLLDLTLPTLAENLALDEALLDAAEAGELSDEVLRLWEFPQPVVVVGRSSRVSEEVNVAACQAAGVPILRRSSGGAAIVAGPGCLMYSILLHYDGRQHLRMIDQAHRHVLGIVARALQSLDIAAEHCGTSDLAIRDRKFSGNSLRCKREHLLYHGTLLYQFDLALIERLLQMPPRVPEYRERRRHREFVMNLATDRSMLIESVIRSFDVTGQLVCWPQTKTAELTASRYANEEWTRSR
jgi:lipoate-protein ligase A